MSKLADDQTTFTQSKQELFAPLSRKVDNIEIGRATLYKTLPSKNKISIWKARLDLTRALNDSLDEIISNPQSDAEQVSELKRVTDVLKELDEDAKINIDSNFRSARIGNPQSDIAEINHLKGEIQNKISQLQPVVDVWNATKAVEGYIGASNAQDILAKKQKAAETVVESLAGFDSNNLLHLQARDQIVKFNMDQPSAVSTISDPQERGRIFKLLINHPEIVTNGTIDSVVASAREGINIIHKALTSDKMGDWSNEESKITDHLLPKLSQVDSEVLKQSAEKIIKEYADSIWKNGDTSVSARIAGGARSIQDKYLQKVNSKTIEQALVTLPSSKLPSQSEKAPPLESLIPATHIPISIDEITNPADLSAFAANQFEIAIANFTELKALADSNCYSLMDRISQAKDSSDVANLSNEIAEIPKLTRAAQDSLESALTNMEQVPLKMLDMAKDLTDENTPESNQARAAFVEAHKKYMEAMEQINQSKLQQGAQKSCALLDNLLSSAQPAVEEVKKAIASESALVAKQKRGLLGSLKDRVLSAKSKPTHPSPSTPSPSNATEASAQGGLDEYMTTKIKNVARIKQEMDAARLEAERRADSWIHNSVEKGRSVAAAAAASAQSTGYSVIRASLREIVSATAFLGATAVGEGARFAKNNPKATAAAVGIYGAVAAAPYVIGTAVTGAVMSTETGRNAAGKAAKAAAVVG